MTTILEDRIVNAPLTRATGYLRQYIREVFTKHNGRLTLSVAMPVRRSNGDPIEVREDVAVDFEKMVKSNLLTGQTAIAWRPVHGGGFIPSFSGHFIVTADKSCDCCRLVLEGAYEPPLGPIGALFDVAIGNALAQATAQRLLKRVGQDIENIHFESTTATAPRST